MASTLERLLARAGVVGRPAILDGGFGQLLADEAPELDLSDGLWASGVAVRSPGMVRAIHRRFLEAGADIISTATYQASAQGYVAAGIAADEAAADNVMAAALEIAVDARNEHMSRTAVCSRPLIAASLGSIGATLSNLSEYTGDYGHGMTETNIREFHLQRLLLLARCLQMPRLREQIDLVAIETIPSLMETSAVVSALHDLSQRRVELPPTWISFTASTDGCVGHGEPIEAVIEAAANSPSVCAVGFNCIPVNIASNLLKRARRVTSKPIVCYPNGQTWSGSDEDWQDKRLRITPADFAIEARRWIDCGATIVGGCCRTTPEHIRAISNSVG